METDFTRKDEDSRITTCGALWSKWTSQSGTDKVQVENCVSIITTVSNARHIAHDSVFFLKGYLIELMKNGKWMIVRGMPTSSMMYEEVYFKVRS